MDESCKLKLLRLHGEDDRAIHDPDSHDVIGWLFIPEKSISSKEYHCLLIDPDIVQVYKTCEVSFVLEQPLERVRWVELIEIDESSTKL